MKIAELDRTVGSRLVASVQAQLTAAGLTELAALIGEGDDSGRASVAFVATDAGILVASLAPNQDSDMVLDSTVVAWSDVFGAKLIVSTWANLADSSVMAMRVQHPDIAVRGQPSERDQQASIRDFAKVAMRLQSGSLRRPEEPPEPA